MLQKLSISHIKLKSSISCFFIFAIIGFWSHEIIVQRYTDFSFNYRNKWESDFLFLDITRTHANIHSLDSTHPFELNDIFYRIIDTLRHELLANDELLCNQQENQDSDKARQLHWFDSR